MISKGFLFELEKKDLKKPKRFNVLSEAFGAVKEIKLGGLEQTYIDKFSEAAKRLAKVNATAKVITYCLVLQ